MAVLLCGQALAYGMRRNGTSSAGNLWQHVSPAEHSEKPGEVMLSLYTL